MGWKFQLTLWLRLFPARLKPPACSAGLKLLMVLLVWPVITVAQAPGAPVFQTSNAPPPGFEGLDARQITEVDVIYAGNLLLSTMAEFDAETIEFLNPSAIANAVPFLLDPDLIAEALAGPLNSHAHLVCHRNNPLHCGHVDAAPAAVIFDASRFRATLFIDRLQLGVQSATASRYLPPSQALFSTTHAIGLTAAGRNGDSAFTLSSSSIAAIRQSRLRTELDISSHDGLGIDELVLEHESRDWLFEGGAFRTRGRSVAFVNEQNLFGLRVASSLNSRADLDTAEGTPILLFLTQRSRVDIFRNDRLLDSRFYEAGNQQLDTSRLPDGAYDVTVRVQEPGGPREQRYYFVRTGLLPPQDQPLYFAEVGALTDVTNNHAPQLTGSAWLRGGVARRLRDDLGVEGNLLLADGQAMIEAGLFWFAPGLSLQSSAMLTGGGDAGLSVHGAYHQGDHALSFNYRNVRSAAASDANFALVPESYSQGSLTYSLPVFNGRLFARAQLDSRGDFGARSALGLSWLRPLMRRRDYNLDLSVDAQVDGNESLFRVGVDLRWRRDKLHTTVAPRVQSLSGSTQEGTHLLLDARATRQAQGSQFGDVRSSTFLSQQVDRRSLGARVETHSERGYADLEIEHVSQQAGSGLGYSANSRFSVVSTRENVAWGGGRNESAAVVLDIDGLVEGATFEVFVNRQSRGLATPGRRTVVPLRAYESYDIRLEPRGDVLVDFDERAHSVTLYPGNVHVLHYDVAAITVLVGQALDPQGAPIRNARFAALGGFAGTDDHGWFQIETGRPDTLQLVSASGISCTMTVPPYYPEQGLAVLDELECVPDDAAVIPE